MPNKEEKPAIESKGSIQSIHSFNNYLLSIYYVPGSVLSGIESYRYLYC